MHSRDQITLTVGSSLSYRLAVLFAEEIHAELIRRHLKRIGFAERYDVNPGAMDEVRRAIRSIHDDGRYGARREFILTLRFIFRELMKKKDTEPRWQTYVQRVAAFQDMPAPGDINDPAWETFVLKQPHKRDAAA